MEKDAYKLMAELQSKVYKTKSKKIFDFDITLINLSAREDADVYSMVSDMKGTEFFHILKIHTLARSLTSINDVSFPKSENEDENLKLIKSKVDLLLSLPSTIVDELYQVYSDLINEIDASLGKGESTEDDTLEIKTAQNIHAMNVLTEN